LTSDFVPRAGGGGVELLHHDIGDWTITFAETGETVNIGQRLKAAQKDLEGEEVFLSNHADELTDLPPPDQVEFSRRQQATATFLCVRAKQILHIG